MAAKRTDRVSALLKMALAELLLRGVKDPRVQMVTVTGVEMSPDLKHARVFNRWARRRGGPICETGSRFTMPAPASMPSCTRARSRLPGDGRVIFTTSTWKELVTSSKGAPFIV